MTNKNNKKKWHWSVKVGPVVGLITLVAFYMLYGWELLLRYILGGLLFASVTLPIIVTSFNKTKNKKIGR